MSEPPIGKHQDKPPLPSSEQVDIATLAQLFNDTTNSYKYIFFLSLLELLRARNFDCKQPIALEEILVEMLVTCWYPHTYFKLSFGTQDKLAAGLEAMQLERYGNANNIARAGKDQVRQLIVDSGAAMPEDLLRYVPYRIIRPFFSAETRGLKDTQVNETISRYSLEQFEERRPLYRIDTMKRAVVVHPDWADYLRANYVFIKGWISWEWSEYMQRRNPNVPSVAQKLFPPDRRETLAEQTKYWKGILQLAELRCIYSAEVIRPDNFSLDHYLPWSFVVHDQLWNLIPTLPSVNSAKSDNLPAAHYFEKFVDMQFAGLNMSRNVSGVKEWEMQVEPFVANLRLSYLELLDRKRLTHAFSGTVKPLIDLAASQGFSPEWSFCQM